MGDNLIVWHWVIPPVSLRALPLKGVAISMPLHRDRHVAHAPRDDREKRNRNSEPRPERQQGISLLEITTASVTNVLDEYKQLTPSDKPAKIYACWLLVFSNQAVINLEQGRGDIACLK